MDLMDMKITDLEKAMDDPNTLALLRQMDPSLAAMSDEDFSRCADDLRDRLSLFKAKFGNLNGQSIMKMGGK